MRVLRRARNRGLTAAVMSVVLWFTAAMTCAQTPPPPGAPPSPQAPPTLELGLQSRAGSGGRPPGPGRGGAVRPRRLVRLFDFEETDDRGQKIGAGYPLPPHWYAIGKDPRTADPNFLRQPLHRALIDRPGFPAYTAVGYAGDQHTSGQYALHLGLNGGSAGAFLETGAVQAIPGSDYLVTARIRTARLQRAHARLTAYFIDEQGQRIATGDARTEPIQTHGQWTTVSLRLVGQPDTPAWIGMELTLDQPVATPASPLGPQQVVIQDIQGEAWFDDIAVWQLPHVQVATQSPVNLVRGPDRPELDLGVRDLTGQHLTARVTVYDQALRPVAEDRRPVGAGRPNRWSWSPSLPGFGWYMVELAVYQGLSGSQDQAQRNAAALVRAYGAVGYLPPDGALPTGERGRFILDATGAPPDTLSLLPEVLQQSGLGSVVLPAWRHDTTPGNIQQQQRDLDDLLQRVATGDREVSLSLQPMPDKLAADPAAAGMGVLELLASPPSTWQGYVGPVLSRQGQRVRRWRLGTMDETTGFYDPDLAGQLRSIRSRFLRRTPGPELVVPWSLPQSYRPTLDRGVAPAIVVPWSVAPAQIGAYLQGWSTAQTPRELHLRVPPADALSQPQRVSSLVRRMLYAWAVGRTRLAIDAPWARAEERRVAVLPGPLLPAFVNTAHRLAGRSVVDRLTLGTGLASMVLDGPAGGMLAAWNDRAPEGGAEVAMYLGDKPVAVDVWGNRRPLPMREGKQHFKLGPTPIFIEGINPELARFRASFVVNKPFIESSQDRHRRTLKLTNPWPRTISGRLRTTGPEGWSVQPAQQFFSIPAGETVELPITLGFPVSEVAGSKRLTAAFDFNADKRYRVDLSTPLELGLSDIEMVASLSLSPAPGSAPAPGNTPGSTPGSNSSPAASGDASGGTSGGGGGGAVVHMVVTNTSDRRRSLYMFASLPGFPREERPIPRLEPGQSVVRTFRFEGAAGALSKYPIRCGVRETNGPAVLNQKLTLDQVF